MWQSPPKINENKKCKRKLFQSFTEPKMEAIREDIAEESFLTYTRNFICNLPSTSQTSTPLESLQTQREIDETEAGLLACSSVFPRFPAPPTPLDHHGMALPKPDMTITTTPLARPDLLVRRVNLLGRSTECVQSTEPSCEQEPEAQTMEQFYKPYEARLNAIFEASKLKDEPPLVHLTEAEAVEAERKYHEKYAVFSKPIANRFRMQF